MSVETNENDFDNNSANKKVDLDTAVLNANTISGIVDEDINIEFEIKMKNKSAEHALEVRRAIEERLERNRLQKELDYLFDEHFTDEEE